MDTILLLVILALAASGSGSDYAPPEDAPVIEDSVPYEQKTSKEQWEAMRQHPELTESSGERAQYAPSIWSFLFKKPVSKDKAGAKAKISAGANKNGEPVGEIEVAKPDESIKTKKNTTSALKAEVSDDANKTTRSEGADAKPLRKLKVRSDSGG
jgi:hypothetical protein